MSFFLPMFGSSTNRRRKLTTHLKSWRNFESGICLLCKNIYFKIWHFDLILTWPWSKVNFDGIIGSDDHHYRYLHVKWPTNMCRTACLWLLFSGDLLWPDLDVDLSRYDLCTHADFQICTSTVCEFGLFAACLTDSTATNVFTFNLTLTLCVTFIFRC